MPTVDTQEKTAGKIVADILAGVDVDSSGLPLEFDYATESKLLVELRRRDTPVLSTESGPVHGP